MPLSLCKLQFQPKLGVFARAVASCSSDAFTVSPFRDFTQHSKPSNVTCPKMLPDAPVEVWLPLLALAICHNLIPGFKLCPHLSPIHVLPLLVPYAGCALRHVRHCQSRRARAWASGTPRACSATSLPRVHKPLSPTVRTGSLASYTKFILLDIEDSRENIKFFQFF